MVVLGVDGCPGGGWVGALVSARTVRLLALPDARAVLAVDAEAIAIDIPIGLPDSGPRRSDVAARRLLGSRGVCVFPAPVRAVLTADSYADACAAARRASGRALSRQTWGIVPRIADLDRRLGTRPGLLDRRVIEAHPELSFLTWHGTNQPLPAKKTPAGRAARMELVGSWLGELPALPRPARLEDALDALACAWTAQRWLTGEARILPEDGAPTPPRDALGRPMRIVA